jgi:hypothetical protein
VWEIDFTSRLAREKSSQLRDIQIEKRIEEEVTQVIRENFSFRFIEMEKQLQRMGRQGLESRLIGTIAHCGLCGPSSTWLGRHSPRRKIQESGIWLVHYLNAQPISEQDRDVIHRAVGKQEHIR